MLADVEREVIGHVRDREVACDSIPGSTAVSSALAVALPMIILFAIIGIVLIVSALADAFEVVLLPRPIKRWLRPTGIFFNITWPLWTAVAARLPPGGKREALLSVYGPLSMVLLLCLWAISLICGFGLLHWALEGSRSVTQPHPLLMALLDSGAAFFTLEYAAVASASLLSRFLVIIEAGMGFGFIALTVSYLPVLYQHFYRRDIQLVQLAERAGSPPTAANVFARFSDGGRLNALEAWLREWELWAAELLESHNTYPMLAYYRSQHEGVSWLAALTVILDCCTLATAGMREASLMQSVSTFVSARLALTEMSRSLGVPPLKSALQGSAKRCQREALQLIEEMLVARQIPWTGGRDTEKAVAALCATYEPILFGLSAYLLLPLPDWANVVDLESQRGDWERIVARLSNTNGLTPQRPD